MPSHAHRCLSCGAELAPTEIQGKCPHCGQLVQHWGFAPTLDAATLDGAAAPLVPEEPDRDPLVGTRLAHYDVEAFCGAGGMARVYRARHVHLHRPCALKLLDPDRARRHSGVIEEFLAEARAAAGLVHPHVVTIHTIGEDRGRHFIEMEYVEGRCLSHVLANSSLDLQRAMRFSVHIGAALAAAHARGLIHRDIKPANVLISSGDVAKLADFGLAKHLDDLETAGAGPGLTGTPLFMAPELFRGERATPQSDVYAFGVTLFLLCAGRLPFAGQSLRELARQHREEPPPELTSGCPVATPEIAAIVARCLAKDPADRYADASELLVDLRAAYMGLRSLESLLREALLGQTSEIIGRGPDRFLVRVTLGRGRAQDVFVEGVAGPHPEQRIVRVFSRCAPANPGYFRLALELNALIPYGALAIDDLDGQPYFVMLHAHTRSTCDPVELRASILSVAAHADDVERALSGSDRH